MEDEPDERIKAAVLIGAPTGGRLPPQRATRSAFLAINEPSQDGLLLQVEPAPTDFQYRCGCDLGDDRQSTASTRASATQFLVELIADVWLCKEPILASTAACNPPCKASLRRCRPQGMPFSW